MASTSVGPDSASASSKTLDSSSHRLQQWSLRIVVFASKMATSVNISKHASIDQQRKAAAATSVYEPADINPMGRWYITSPNYRKQQSGYQATTTRQVLHDERFHTAQQGFGNHQTMVHHYNSAPDIRLRTDPVAPDNTYSTSQHRATQHWCHHQLHIPPAHGINAAEASKLLTGGCYFLLTWSGAEFFSSNAILLNLVADAVHLVEFEDGFYLVILCRDIVRGPLLRFSGYPGAHLWVFWRGASELLMQSGVIFAVDAMAEVWQILGASSTLISWNLLKLFNYRMVTTDGPAEAWVEGHADACEMLMQMLVQRKICPGCHMLWDICWKVFASSRNGSFAELYAVESFH
ncbi:hypothetical protein Nepgr_007860 [Nepenthes gracilis]|uniref:Uncharacterized protein n=1 Tax=Nepenthes gracilis TaxID=150966 RepID=A0AAD3S7R6_NEPGR|nr:hypothetical protein Nepgr_007860 [Nepenthes gracilis]